MSLNKQTWNRWRAGIPWGCDKTEDSIAQFHKGVSRAGETTQDLDASDGDVYKPLDGCATLGKSFTFSVHSCFF